jgi:hypothetical protein
MMRTRKKQRTAPGLVMALLLALLLNLSGHMFLHLGDAVLEANDAHLSAPEEKSTSPASQHTCSICQNHQQLALDSPATTSYFLETFTLTANRGIESVVASPSFQRPSDRAPPRN